jgi:hypothetical protein
MITWWNCVIEIFSTQGQRFNSGGMSNRKFLFYIVIGIVILMILYVIMLVCLNYIHIRMHERHPSLQNN